MFSQDVIETFFVDKLSISANLKTKSAFDNPHSEPTLNVPINGLSIISFINPHKLSKDRGLKKTSLNTEMLSSRLSAEKAQSEKLFLDGDLLLPKKLVLIIVLGTLDAASSPEYFEKL